MPGLLGIIDHQKKLGVSRIEELLTLMSRSLQHEDFYHTAQYVREEFGIARISKQKARDVRDKFPAPQDNNLLFFYGDLYVFNGKDVLGDAYLNDFHRDLTRNFSKTVSNIDGDFLFVYYNSQEKKLCIVNDITSSIPVYYAVVDEVLYFAPEVKALLKIPSLDKQINFTGLAQFLSSGMVYSGNTYFNSIKALMMSTVMSVHFPSHKIVQAPYWSFNFDETVKDKGMSCYAEPLADLINKAIKRRVRDNTAKRIGVFLSGGYDSRTILAACLQNNVQVETITHGVEQQKPFSDALIAKELSDKLGIKNHFHKLIPNDMQHHLQDVVYRTDGLTDQVGNYPSGLDNQRQMRESFDVVLRGEELFGWQGGVFNEDDALASFNLVPLPNKYRSILGEKHFPGMRQASEAGLKNISKRCGLKDLMNRKDLYVFAQGVPHFWGILNYFKNMVIDIRNPLWDKDLLTFIAKLPPQYRIYRNLFRRTVRTAYPDIFSIEGAKSSNLPNWTESYRDHPDLRAYIRSNLIDSSNPFIEELINREGLNIFVSKFEEAALNCAQKSTGLSVKAFQSSFRWKDLLPTDFKTFLAHLIKSNYIPYKMALPLFKNKKITVSWLRDDVVMMRLLVLKHWSDLFI
ncbi:MAG: asparagine synthase [Candidatus Omnitrophica bacterium]|nr:asparagine synthase [Candidatus Omnitrophota bacterium]